MAESSHHLKQDSLDIQHTLQHLEEQNALILRAAGEGIFGLDLEGHHTFVNPAATQLLGYEPGELLGKSSHVT